jgi:hypothetical protein
MRQWATLDKEDVRQLMQGQRSSRGRGPNFPARDDSILSFGLAKDRTCQRPRLLRAILLERAIPFAPVPE